MTNSKVDTSLISGSIALATPSNLTDFIGLTLTRVDAVGIFGFPIAKAKHIVNKIKSENGDNWF